MKSKYTAFVLLCAIICLAAILSGCDGADEYRKADHKVLYDSKGCAYYVRPNIGDNSFVRRMPDGDLASCNISNAMENAE